MTNYLTKQADSGFLNRQNPKSRGLGLTLKPLSSIVGVYDQTRQQNQRPIKFNLPYFTSSAPVCLSGHCDA